MAFKIHLTFTFPNHMSYIYALVVIDNGIHFQDSTVAMAPGESLEPLRREMEDTHQAVEDNESQVQLCIRKKRKLEDDVTETRENSDIVRRYTDMLTEDKRSLEKKLEEKEKEIKSLQAQHFHYEKIIRDLEVKLAIAGTKAKQKEKNKLKLIKQEKEELVKRIEAKQKELSEVKETVSKLKLKLDRAQKELSDTESQLELKTSQLAEVQKELKLTQDQRDKLRGQLEAQERAMEEAVMQHADSDQVTSKVHACFKIAITDFVCPLNHTCSDNIAWLPRQLTEYKQLNILPLVCAVSNMNEWLVLCYVCMNY